METQTVSPRMYPWKIILTDKILSFVKEFFYLKESENAQSSALHKMEQYLQSCTEKGIDRFFTERVILFCANYILYSAFFPKFMDLFQAYKRRDPRNV